MWKAVSLMSRCKCNAIMGLNGRLDKCSPESFWIFFDGQLPVLSLEEVIPDVFHILCHRQDFVCLEREHRIKYFLHFSHVKFQLSYYSVICYILWHTVMLFLMADNFKYWLFIDLSIYLQTLFCQIFKNVFLLFFFYLTCYLLYLYSKIPATI